jgi:hypothetical protein
MRIERINALLAAGLHHHAPAARQAGFQQPRQHVFKPPARQMIEKDFWLSFHNAFQ